MWKDGVEICETYNYNLQTQQLKEKQIGLSDGGTLKITYTYPNDCPWGIYTTMTRKHCISPIVEEKKFKNGRLMESILTEYLQVSEGLYLPSVQHYSEITTPLVASTMTFSSAGRNKTVYPADNIMYHHYDKYGHVLNLSVNNRESTYLWSYKGQYPVAEIDNVSYDTVRICRVCRFLIWICYAACVLSFRLLMSGYTNTSLRPEFPGRCFPTVILLAMNMIPLTVW